jgi:hypothetical protein
MSQTSESGTVQVKRFVPEADTTPYGVLLIVAAAALGISLILAQLELYFFYHYIFFFKLGG